MPEFDGLAAIITGGASGIGAAVAELLAGRGVHTAVLDVHPPTGQHRYASCDITDREAVRAAVHHLAGELGGVDVLVNNAGIGAQGDVTANDDAEWQHVLDVNVTGIARVSTAALPYLRRSGHPAIVNTCSIAATAGLPNRALYSASKGAVLSLTLAMAADHVHEGIRVNCVTPGTVDTPWIQRLLSTSDDPVAQAEMLRARQPIGRLVTAGEVAAAIAYLAGPASGATTGTVLPVDGGMQSLRLPR